MTRHVIEALGKARVVIEDGKVVEVGEPLVTYCPLFFKHRGITEFTPDIIRKNIEFRIKDFGMCTPERKLRMRDFLSFGVSELLGMAVANGTLDCAVIVCEGAGTVIIDEPEMVQGIGGRVSGILETDPIPEVIAGIGPGRVLDPASGRIDQLEGARKARQMGYRKMGISVASGSDAERIRHEFGSDAVLFGVHTTLLDEREAELMLDHADIVTACASRCVRAEARSRRSSQVGTKVPIYATSEIGKTILDDRLRSLKMEWADKDEDPPRPLV
ncbi:MAG TPA: methanogenesis marker 8 protein [Methanomassiliicoccales archaeon]|nr:methanogenesis marker 8 protein [Methanomassiliicoccales archaeon]